MAEVRLPRVRSSERTERIEPSRVESLPVGSETADAIDRNPRPRAPDALLAPREAAVEALKRSTQTALNQLGDRVWDELMKHQPMWATMEGYRRSETDSQMDVHTPARWRRHFAEMRKSERIFGTKIEPRISELDGVGGTLDVPAQLLADALRSVFDGGRVQEELQPYLWSIGTTWDLQSTLAELGSRAHAIAGEGPGALKQATDLERRYAKVGQLFEQKIAQFRAGAKQGLIAPPAVIEDLIRQVGDLARAPIDESPFLGTTRAWLAEVEQRGRVPRKIGDAGRRIEGAVRTVVLPALEAYRAYLEHELLPQAKVARGDRPGVGHLPRGEEYYAAELHEYAGTALSFKELAELGEREIAAITSTRLDAASTLLGRPIGEGDLAAAAKEIERLPENRLPEGQARLALAQELADRALALFARITDVRALPLVVEFTEGSGTAQYLKAPADGSRPARLQIGATGGDFASFVATIAHEVWHHLQFSAMQGAGGSGSLHPLAVASYFTAAIEGGALFAEDLAGALGMYDFPGDARRSALAAFGATSNQLLRAWRIRADLHLHAPSLDPSGKGWTIEQAVRDGVAVLGAPESEVREEVLRYASWPAQATSYMIGKLELRRRKLQAKEALGDRSEGIMFADPKHERDYNDLVLLTSGARFR